LLDWVACTVSFNSSIIESSFDGYSCGGYFDSGTFRLSFLMATVFADFPFGKLESSLFSCTARECFEPECVLLASLAFDCRVSAAGRGFGGLTSGTRIFGSTGGGSIFSGIFSSRLPMCPSCDWTCS
jgi:hypothetical protein